MNEVIIYAIIHIYLYFPICIKIMNNHIYTFPSICKINNYIYMVFYEYFLLLFIYKWIKYVCYINKNFKILTRYNSYFVCKCKFFVRWRQIRKRRFSISQHHWHTACSPSCCFCFGLKQNFYITFSERNYIFSTRNSCILQ